MKILEEIFYNVGTHSSNLLAWRSIRILGVYYFELP